MGKSLFFQLRHESREVFHLIRNLFLHRVQGQPILSALLRGLFQVLSVQATRIGPVLSTFLAEELEARPPPILRSDLADDGQFAPARASWTCMRQDPQTVTGMR